MAIRKAKVTLEGISPLLMHAFPMDPIEGIGKQPKEEQAKQAAYIDPETKELYVPGVAVQRALIAAAAYSKGKGRASLQKNAAACFQVDPERISLGTKTYEIDSRPVVVPATKGRIIRHRPKLEKWHITFELEWDDVLISDKEARQIMDDMGRRVGLLDFRPATKGPFGRCVIVNWEMF